MIERSPTSDPVLQSGLLMEAAQAQQKLAEDSLERLQTHLRDLDAVVRHEIRHTLNEALVGLTVESERAACALRRVGQRADLRILVWTVVVTVVSATVAVGLARWMSPSPARIAALRQRERVLLTRIAHLKSLGAGIELRRCGVHRRLCVRVERRGPAYGAHGQYLLVMEK